MHRLKMMWADAVRFGQYEEADRLWKLLMTEWLTPVMIEQDYYSELLDRMIKARERQGNYKKITDEEWDNAHADINQ